MGPQQDPSTAPTAPRTNGTAAGRKEGNKVVRYRQCQRNHAASTGGHAVDGCREFMASAAAEAGTGAAAALLCAACGCHRSFHRREVEAEAAAQRDRDCDAPPTPPAPGDRR